MKVSPLVAGKAHSAGSTSRPNPIGFYYGVHYLLNTVHWLPIYVVYGNIIPYRGKFSYSA